MTQTEKTGVLCAGQFQSLLLAEKGGGRATPYPQKRRQADFRRWKKKCPRGLSGYAYQAGDKYF
eukprot:3837961-Rhodomonas_salina.1